MDEEDENEWTRADRLSQSALAFSARSGSPSNPDSLSHSIQLHQQARQALRQARLKAKTASTTDKESLAALKLLEDHHSALIALICGSSGVSPPPTQLDSPCPTDTPDPSPFPSVATSVGKLTAASYDLPSAQKLTPSYTSVESKRGWSGSQTESISTSGLVSAVIGPTAALAVVPAQKCPTPISVTSPASTTQSLLPHTGPGAVPVTGGQQNPTAATVTHLISILQLVQVLVVFNMDGSSISSAGSFSASNAILPYSRFQSYLRQLSDLIHSVHDVATQISRDESATPLTAQEEQQLEKDLMHKFEAADTIHRTLSTFHSQELGMSPAQVSALMQQFLSLQQTQFDTTRRYLRSQIQLARSSARLEEIQRSLERGMMNVEQMLQQAAMQAAHTIAEKGSMEAAILAQQQQQQTVQPHPTVTPNAAASSDAQVRQLLEEKRKMESKLASMESALKSERALREKQARIIDRYEQRWKQLNEKVQEKKKNMMAAAAAAAGHGGSQSNASSTSSSPNVSPSHASHSHSPHAHASGHDSSHASGSVSRPAPLSHSSRSLSGSSSSSAASPFSLHAARPVNVGASSSGSGVGVRHQAMPGAGSASGSPNR